MPDKDVGLMRIAAADVALASRHAYSETYARQESLRIWRGDAGPGAPARPGGDRLELSADNRRGPTVPTADCPAQAGAPLGADELAGVSGVDRCRILVLEWFLGLKVTVPEWDAAPAADTAELQQAVAAAERGPARAGWGLAYDLHESYTESEQLTVTASGVIRAADGREIAFAVEFTMSREFAVEQNIRIRAGDARLTDPLLINYAGSLPALTEQKFHFDLDADGRDDLIPLVQAGSGFLALDRDGDGRIGSGRELFGPATGNGFAELAAHDADGNGWIDESDPVFHRLRIWTRDAGGRDVLFALADQGIGAMYLGNVQAPFTVKDAANETAGRFGTAGIFVRESGSAGTIQQLDIRI